MACKSSASRILSDAFEDDPFFVWINSEFQQRRRLLETLFEISVSVAAQKGLLEEDGPAVLIYEPPGQTLLSEVDEKAFRSAIEVAFERPPEVLHRYSAETNSAPDELPVWYLRYLAVAKHRRGEGAGSRLLSRFLRSFDVKDGLVRLHTARPSNLLFYSRFGFRVSGVVRCDYGPSGPSVYTMERTMPLWV
jgi:GNAT superfamily N-acetyltransferase